MAIPCLCKPANYGRYSVCLLSPGVSYPPVYTAEYYCDLSFLLFLCRKGNILSSIPNSKVVVCTLSFIVEERSFYRTGHFKANFVTGDVFLLMHHKKTLATHKIANFAFDDGAYHSPVPIIHRCLSFTCGCYFAIFSSCPPGFRVCL